MALIDFAILTALPEELKAIMDVFPAFEEVSENSSVWYRTVLTSRDGKRAYHIVAAVQTQLGQFGALELTKSAISKWNPSYIILAGIAGSFHEKVKLGDVIVSQQVFYYDPGKAVNRKGLQTIEYRPQGYPCSVTLIRQAEAIALTGKNWIEQAAESAKKKLSGIPSQVKQAKENLELVRQLKSHKPDVHFGTVASGSLVIADEKRRNQLLQIHGKIIGTEMEGAGVMHASFYEETPFAAIVIKGISDGANSKKSKLDEFGLWREMAKENSARFIFDLIYHGKFREVRTDKFLLSAETGPPGDAREMIQDAVAPGNGAFLSFPKLVLPQGPLTSISVWANAEGTGGVPDVEKIVLNYTDDKNTVQKFTAEGNYIEIKQSISTFCISAYIRLSAGADSINFKVKSFYFEKDIVCNL